MKRENEIHFLLKQTTLAKCVDLFIQNNLFVMNGCKKTAKKKNLKNSIWPFYVFCVYSVFLCFFCPFMNTSIANDEHLKFLFCFSLFTYLWQMQIFFIELNEINFFFRLKFFKSIFFLSNSIFIIIKLFILFFVRKKYFDGNSRV